MKKIILTISLITIASSLACYFFIKRFKADRQSAMNFVEQKRLPIQISQNGIKRETKTYTKEELDEMRKKGQLPSTHIPNSPGELNTQSAVERSLRTVEEINRINRMNQQLIDQQRRMQQKQN